MQRGDFADPLSFFCPFSEIFAKATRGQKQTLPFSFFKVLSKYPWKGKPFFPSIWPNVFDINCFPVRVSDVFRFGLSLNSYATKAVVRGRSARLWHFISINDAATQSPGLTRHPSVSCIILPFFRPHWVSASPQYLLCGLSQKPV